MSPHPSSPPSGGEEEETRGVALPPERRQGWQAGIAGPRRDAETGHEFAHFARRADLGATRVDAGEPHQARDDPLPAIALDREAPHLDLARHVDAGLGLGDAEGELQAAQLVDQSGTPRIDAGEDASA